MRSKDDHNVYKVTCGLPGIKPTLGNFEKQEEAKAKLESAVKHWFSKLNE
jgi:hypothetical protein